MRPGRGPEEPPAGMRGCGRRPRRKRLGRRVRQLHGHGCADLIFLALPAAVLTCYQLYKRILRVIRRDVWAFEAAPVCRRDVPYAERVRGDGDGWVVSDSGAATGAGTARRVCCCGRRAPTARAAVLLQHRAPWSHQGGTWGLPGGARDSHETAEAGRGPRGARGGRPARRPADRARDRGHRRGRRRADALDLHHRDRRRRRTAARPCPTGRAPSCAGWPRTRSPTLPLHPGFAASWARLRAVAATIPLLQAVSSAAGSPRRCGSSAAVIARTTTTRRAPASSTSGSRCSSMPPIANHGLSGAADAAAARTSVQARARRGPAWSAWASTARRRSSRPARRPRRRPGRGRGWTGRSACRARRCRARSAAAGRPGPDAARRRRPRGRCRRGR